MIVWIVNPFDALPAEGHRPLRFWLMAEAFARAGHDVVYWTADFNHIAKRRRTPDADALARSAAQGIRVEFVHEPPYSRNIGLKRLWAHWRWADNWAKAAAKSAPPGLIVASSPPLSAAAKVLRFARGVGAKVVVDVMDAWPETFERIAPRWMLWPLRRIARANYLGADAVTTVADNYAALVAGYGRRRPAHRFYHGIDMSGPPPDLDRRTGDRMKIAYAGNLGSTYDLATAIEAVGLMDGATLAVAGKGAQESMLADAARRFAGKVSFAGYLDEESLRRFLASADVGLVPMSPESCVGVPYKFADYSRAGLAIVSSLGGESDMLLAKYGAGASYRAHDARSLAAALRSLSPRLAEAKAASRRMAEAEFDATAIYDEYVGFVMAERSCAFSSPKTRKPTRLE